MNVLTCARLAAALSAVTFPSALLAEGLQLSGGLDVKASAAEDADRSRLRLEGAFLNLRKVWSDELGDRWIGVAQADFDDNFERVRPYQVYLQYKGPLGKWNLRGGHYLLPFGLLATHDTERLILQGLERTSLGIRKDTGVQLFGRFGPWDYAVSISDGLSDLRFVDPRANPVLTARLAHVRSNLQVGVSTLVGSTLTDPEFGIDGAVLHQRKLCLDVTKLLGRLTVRAEAVGGTEEGRTVGGGLLLGDFALTPTLELNTRYSGWSRGSVAHCVGSGLTYQIRSGLWARMAWTLELAEGTQNDFTLQLYYEFTRHF